MKNLFLVSVSLLFILSSIDLAAQTRPARPGRNGTPGKQDAKAELDSLRKLEDEGRDTLIITSRFIRYTTLGLLRDSTQTLPLDTSFRQFHNYNPLNQPHQPTINLGNLGLAYREMLYTPSSTIGFDPGFHALDLYLLTQDSIKYYRARSPFTSLSYINGQLKEQFFKVTHSQNIKPNWNFGANYFRIGSEGFYRNQKADHLNAAAFTWYESPNRRYNLLANGLFNTLRAAENGSIVNEEIFSAERPKISGSEVVRIGNGSPRFDKKSSPHQEWKHKEFFVKQFYYLGRLDSLEESTNSNILPTQRVSHALTYSNKVYKFFKNEKQNPAYPVFPKIHPDSSFAAGVPLTLDSTRVRNLRNEFMYSFYLRGRSVSFIKNEMKLDVGLQHDLYWYNQLDSSANFHNITLKANAGYQFSDRVSINGDIQQIAQGKNAGDYLYNAQTQILLSRSVGRIVLGAFLQNKSPQQIFEQVDYTYHKWRENFKRTKTNSLSFAYLNPKFGFTSRADYYLISNHLYFTSAAPTDTNQIRPVQFDKNINLLKITLGKTSRFGKFTLENFVVYQKTDFTSVLRTPELYTYNSFYFGARLFKSITTNLGFDARWNSPFPTQSYAINVNQFYNSEPAVEFSSYPIVDVWAKFALKRANIFLRYDYINQGLLSKGYYTVNRYPMPNKLLKFGVTWNFYD
ncbi:putative porin [Paradesertivirga mongoliensis]|uniref:Porin n=1 Tax=Paradesertivirga mongoliensis TaxID=2100740 RepID=A0ABW4ZGJ0_9SPHI|nr:putative porin [Pedobacter mongoliensis]